jgi:alpha-N-acetylglucosaminidase
MGFAFRMLEVYRSLWSRALFPLCVFPTWSPHQTCFVYPGPHLAPFYVCVCVPWCVEHAVVCCCCLGACHVCCYSVRSQAEMGWRSEAPDVDEWVAAYAARRYGYKPGTAPSAAMAWALLRTGAYNRSQDVSIIEEEPSINTYTSRNTNATATTEAWRGLIAAATKGEVSAEVGPFLYDLTDVGRQVLSNTFGDLQGILCAHVTLWTEGPPPEGLEASVKSLTQQMVKLLSDFDAVLATNENYLLGTWLSDAESWAFGDESARTNLIFNAKNQLTLWGPDGEINDYAA